MITPADSAGLDDRLNCFLAVHQLEADVIFEALGKVLTKGLKRSEEFFAHDKQRPQVLFFHSGADLSAKIDLFCLSVALRVSSSSNCSKTIR